MRLLAAAVVSLVPAVAIAGHGEHADNHASTPPSPSHTTPTETSSHATTQVTSPVREGTWGGYTGTIRDHRTHPESHPVLRDHRTHAVGGADGGSVGVIEDPGYDPYGYAYPEAVGIDTEPASIEVPHFAIELGTGVRHFADPLAASRTSITGTAESYTLSGNGGADSAVTTQLRVLFHTSHAIYVGAEGELGGIVGAPNAVLEGSQGTSMGPSSELLMGAAGVMGAMHREGNARIGVELAGGVRTLKYSFQGLGQNIDQSVVQGVIEPRVRAEYWVSPYVALGATAGANIIANADWMAGAYLAVHTRAFGD